MKTHISREKSWRANFKGWISAGSRLRHIMRNIHAAPISNYSLQPASTRNSGPAARLLGPYEELWGWRGPCDSSCRRFNSCAYPWFRDCRCVGHIVGDWRSHCSYQGSPGALKTSKRLIAKLSGVFLKADDARRMVGDHGLEPWTSCL